MIGFEQLLNSADKRIKRKEDLQKDIYIMDAQIVARGQKNASMGNIGNVYPAFSSYNPNGGTYLHFGVRIGSPYGSAINPQGVY